MKHYPVVTYFIILIMGMSYPVLADPEIDLQTGELLFVSKNYDAAAIYFENLFERYPDNAVIAFNFGKSAFASGNYKIAVDVLEKTVAIDNQQADYYYVLGLAYARYIPEVGMLKQTGIVKKMKSAMQSAVDLDKKHSDARISLISYYLTAPGFAGGSLEEAKKHLDILTLQYPERIFWIQAGFYEKQKKYKEAEATYRLIAKWDASPFNVFNLASYLARKEKYDEAISLFNEFLTMDVGWLDPKKAGAYFMLGMIYEKKKMDGKSEKALQDALAYGPDSWMEKEIQKRLKQQ